MLIILQFYVSSFWIWAGLTVGLAIATQGAVALLVGTARVMRGR